MKHIIADAIKYIGKKTNNLDKSQITGINEDSYLEYENFKEFYERILSLRPETFWINEYHNKHCIG